MSQEIAPIPGRYWDRAGLQRLPKAIARAGERAGWRFIEFFTANIRNRNTRAAYAQAVTQFFRFGMRVVAGGLHYLMAKPRNPWKPGG